MLKHLVLIIVFVVILNSSFWLTFSFIISADSVRTVSNMKRSWHQNVMHENKIFMHENEISMHENDTSLHWKMKIKTLLPKNFMHGILIHKNLGGNTCLICSQHVPVSGTCILSNVYWLHAWLDKSFFFCSSHSIHPGERIFQSFDWQNSRPMF